jgi:hypothetical protein
MRSASKYAAQQGFVSPAAATLAGHLRDHVVAMQTPRHGILLLTAAVQKAAPSPEYITPMHAMLFQWCVPGCLTLMRATCQHVHAAHIIRSMSKSTAARQHAIIQAYGLVPCNKQSARYETRP